MAEVLSAAQRAANFNATTRENIHTMGKQVVTEALGNATFTFPKARLLSKVYLDVSATVKVKGNAGKVEGLDAMTPFGIIKSLNIDLNNGFKPFTIGGKELALLNLIKMNPQVGMPAASGTNCKFDGLTASAEGTTNTFGFCLEVPLTLNEGSTSGMVLLQNQETLVQMSCDIAAPADIFVKDGYSVEIEKVEIQPTLVSFSISNLQTALPDLTVLKLVKARKEPFIGSGENTIKLDTGTIYRKLVVYITDENGVPFTDEDINSHMQLIFNQADSPYNVAPRMVRYINTAHMGMQMPEGVYMFDFSSQGEIISGTGTRDLIDTERLQEFWFKFSSTKAGKITVISETLTRLAAK